MKRLIFACLICSILIPTICGAKEMTITGTFASGTRYAPATFGYGEDQYAFDDEAIGKDWDKYLDVLISTCEDNACDARVNVVPDKDGLYKGIIKSIYSIKINKSAG